MQNTEPLNTGVLMIGFEKNFFVDGSIAQNRLLRYGSLAQEIHVIMFASRALSLAPKKIGENIWLYPTHSFCKPCFLFDAYRIGSDILAKAVGEKKRFLVSAQDPFEAGIVSWFLAKKFGTPLQVQEHGDVFSAPYWRRESLKNFFEYAFGLFVIRRADVVRTVSDRVTETLVRLGVKREKIIKISVRIDVKNYAESIPKEDLDLRKKFPDASLIFFSAARFVPQKNLPLLFDAFALVLQKIPKAMLVIAGKGPLEDALKRHVERLNIGEHVVFFPWGDVASFYKTADTYVLSSDYEGWGMVLVEAMTSGLPVITTDVGCAGEIVKNGENGLVVPVRNMDALSSAMIQLALDKNLRERFATEAQRTVQQMATEEDDLALHKKSFEMCLVTKI